MTIDNEVVIAKLKMAHEAIILALDDIHKHFPSQRQLTVAAYNQVKPYVRHLQESLLGCFQLQKDTLFTHLSSFYSADRENMKMIEFLREDLKNVKIQSLIFFETHPADMGDLGGANFHSDFMNLSDLLAARIKSEQTYLLPLLKSSFNKS